MVLVKKKPLRKRSGKLRRRLKIQAIAMSFVSLLIAFVGGDYIHHSFTTSGYVHLPVAFLLFAIGLFVITMWMWFEWLR